MTFKNHILFATYLAANFDGYRFRIMPDIVSQLLRAAICSRSAESTLSVAALLDSNLSRLPFLGQVVDTDLLLGTGFDLEHVVCSYVIFLLRDE